MPILDIFYRGIE